MLERVFFFAILTFAVAPAALSQEQQQNANATRRRTSTTTTTHTQTNTGRASGEERETPQAAQPGARAPRVTNRGTTGANDPTPRGVIAAFDNLVSGIEHSDVNMVADVYWNSPQLILFNNNGTVTRGWEQMRQNRAQSYPNIKNVKLEIRDRRVVMLGRDGAVVTCLWTQSQTVRGTPETASGRMTLVFKRVGNAWKAVHLHTSPDAPEPSRVAPSERATPQSSPQ